MNKVFKIIGLLMILLGIVTVFLIFFPVAKEEFRYRGIQSRRLSPQSKELIPVDTDFGLVIPKIEINVKVFPQVDADNPAEYLSILKKGVAQSKGSVYPGQEGLVFIFAHSANTPLTISQFNAVFYLLNKLEKDDEMVVYYQGTKYQYQVVDRKIVTPENLTDYLKTLKGETLVLQTCYPPGTTLKRLLIIASPEYRL